jgi:hypothetical protein
MLFPNRSYAMTSDERVAIAKADPAEQFRQHIKNPDFVKRIRFMAEVQGLLSEIFGEREVTNASSTLHVHYLDQMVKEYCSNEPLKEDE